MSDDNLFGVPDFKPDAVAGTALTLSNAVEARALVRRMSGEEDPTRCHFHCVMCGWSKTLHFDEEERAAVGDVRSYTGPCPDCNSMTLQPFDTIANGAFKSIHEMASDNRKKDYSEAADVFIDRVTDRFGGSIASMAPKDPVASGGTTRDQFPDADMSDTSVGATRTKQE